MRPIRFRQHSLFDGIGRRLNPENERVRLWMLSWSAMILLHGFGVVVVMEWSSVSRYTAPSSQGVMTVELAFVQPTAREPMQERREDIVAASPVAEILAPNEKRETPKPAAETPPPFEPSPKVMDTVDPLPTRPDADRMKRMALKRPTEKPKPPSAKPTRPLPVDMEPAAVSPKVRRKIAPNNPAEPTITDSQPKKNGPMKAETQSSNSSFTAAAVSSWQGTLLAHLERYKRYPRAARMGRKEGISMVRFVMDRDGNVLNVQLETSTGSTILDKESLDLIHRSQPLPPPPHEVNGENLDLVIPVRFSLR